METQRLNRFYLEQFMNEVTVMVEDDEGYEWYICTFRKDKPVKLHAAVPNNIGIPVDEDGCIETYKEK